MAIYEYRCRICSHCFEMLILRDGDPGAAVCPACGRRDLDMKRVAGSSGGRIEHPCSGAAERRRRKP